MRTKLIIPISKLDATAANAGIVQDCNASANIVSLAFGFYKVAAMGQPLLFRLGATPVTTSTGAYLAAGDQEIVYANQTVVLLTHIRADSSDGKINVVPINIVEIPGEDPRNYG